MTYLFCWRRLPRRKCPRRTKPERDLAEDPVSQLVEELTRSTLPLVSFVPCLLYAYTHPIIPTCSLPPTTKACRLQPCTHMTRSSIKIGRRPILQSDLPTPRRAADQRLRLCVLAFANTTVRWVIASFPERGHSTYGHRRPVARGASSRQLHCSTRTLLTSPPEYITRASHELSTTLGPAPRLICHQRTCPRSFHGCPYASPWTTRPSRTH